MLPTTYSPNGASNGSSNGSSNGASDGSGDSLPSLSSHLPHFALRINGAAPAAAIMDSLLEATVENSLHLPDMAVLRFEAWDEQKNETVAWANDSTFSPGTAVQVDAGYSNSLSPIFHGEVTAVEMDFSAFGVPTLIVRCLDKSHRMHRGRQSRSFVQMKDSDIVKQLAGEDGLSPKSVDATPDVHEWVFQNNQSNWEFLQERAGRNGHRLFVQGDGELHFKKVKDPEQATLSLEWGTSLRSFRPRLNGGHQVSQVTVKGWDRKTKKAIIGQKSSPNGTPTIGEAKKAQQAGKGFSASGGAKMVVVDKPIFSQSEADGLAQSVFDDIAGEYVEADGLAYGTPDLKAGVTVEIKGVGARFNGKYHISSTTHSYTSAEGYTTQFAITGKRPGNLLSVLQEGGNAGRTEKGGCIVIAIVTDNADPMNVGRVKVTYPWNTDAHTSDWAPVASPMAGAGRGFFFLPEINDEVLVAFEHGDMRRPYVIGGLWNGMDAPVEKNSEAVKGGKVERRTIKTRIGHTILLEDTDGKGEMTLTTCNKHTLTLNDKDQKIEAKTKDGHTITLDDRGKKIVIVDETGSQKITIDSSANSIKMECAGNFDIDAKGKVTIKGALGMDLNTPVQLKASGATVDVSASGPTTIKGAIVQIN